jgi:hypothetical protein
MPWVGFEPTIPVFERAKTFHALDRAATVVGTVKLYMRFTNELIVNVQNFKIQPWALLTHTLFFPFTTLRVFCNTIKRPKMKHCNNRNNLNTFNTPPPKNCSATAMWSRSVGRIVYISSQHISASGGLIHNDTSPGIWIDITDTGISRSFVCVPWIESTLELCGLTTHKWNEHRHSKSG